MTVDGLKSMIDSGDAMRVRTMAGHTRHQVAELLSTESRPVPASAIGRWETGKADPGIMSEVYLGYLNAAAANPAAPPDIASVQQRRENVGMSQAALARRSGVSVKAIRRWESGEAKASLVNRGTYARVDAALKNAEDQLEVLNQSISEKIKHAFAHQQGTGPEPTTYRSDFEALLARAEKSNLAKQARLAAGEVQ